VLEVAVELVIALLQHQAKVTMVVTDQTIIQMLVVAVVQAEQVFLLQTVQAAMAD
jgi:hypothetical protein